MTASDKLKACTGGEATRELSTSTICDLKVCPVVCGKDEAVSCYQRYLDLQGTISEHGSL